MTQKQFFMREKRHCTPSKNAQARMWVKLFPNSALDEMRGICEPIVLNRIAKRLHRKRINRHWQI